MLAEERSLIPEDVTDIVEVDLNMLLSVVIESASKRMQSPMDAPALVTVLTAEEISAMPVASAAELLRWVPGAFVLQPSANTFNVGLRGLNGLTNNAVLTLVDGRSVADPSLGFIPWGVLPVHPSNIERIEVLHGPGSTLYGANALSGVVSITMKRPIDHPGVEMAFQAGTYIVESGPSDPEDTTFIRNGGTGYAAYGWTNHAEDIGLRGSIGFNALPGWDDPVIAIRAIPTVGLGDDIPNTVEPRHGAFNYHATLSAEARPDDDTRVLATVSTSAAEPELILGGVANAIPLAQSEQAVTTLADIGGLAEDRLTLKFGLDGRHYRIRIPALLGTDAQEVATYSAHSWAQADLELFEGWNITTVALEGTWQSTQDFFDISPTSLYGAIVIADEVRLLEEPGLLLSGGVRFETVRSDDGRGAEVVYRNINPRGALVLNVEDRHSVRASFATAYRTPSPFENFATRQLRFFEPPIPLVPFLVPNPQIRPTRSTSYELGYQTRPGDNLVFDLTVFYQQLSDVVGIPRVAQLPLRFDNLGSLTQLGVTASLSHQPSEFVSYSGWYSFTRTEDDRTGDESSAWPDHLAGVGVDLRLPSLLRTTADFAVASPLSTTELVVGDNALTVVEADAPWQLTLNLRLGRYFKDGAGEVFLAGRNLLSLARDHADLIQYPVVGVEPIGASVILGVRLNGR